jgi:hypothetical protein
MAFSGVPAARERSSAIVLVAAGLTPLAFWAILPPSAGVNEASDFRDFYDPVARSLLAGRGLFLAPGVPALAYPPGYPVVLAVALRLARACGLPEHVGLAVLAVAGMAVAALLVHALAARVWGARPALVAALAWITYPLVLWLTKQPNSELPFMVALYAAVLLFWSALERRDGVAARLFACGVAIGVAMLVRSIALGVGVLLVVAFLVMRRDVRAAWLLAGNLLVIAPWLGWVYAETGHVVPLSTGGVPSIRDGLVFAAGGKTYRETFDVDPGVRVLMTRLAAYDLETLGAVAGAVRTEGARMPGAAAKLLALKVRRSWYGTDSGRYEGAIVAIQAVYLGLAFAAMILAVGRGGAARRLAALLALLVLYFWGMTVLVLSVVRYMVPVAGLLFTLLPALLPSTARRPA